MHRHTQQQDRPQTCATNRSRPTPTFVDGSSTLLHPGHALELDAQLVRGRNHRLRHIAGLSWQQLPGWSLLAQDLHQRGASPYLLSCTPISAPSCIPQDHDWRMGVLHHRKPAARRARAASKAQGFQATEQPGKADDGWAAGVLHTLESNINEAGKMLTWVAEAGLLVPGVRELLGGRELGLKPSMLIAEAKLLFF